MLQPLDANSHLHSPALAIISNAAVYNDKNSCALCQKRLSRSPDTWTCIADIKPRFLRLLQKDYPQARLDWPTRRICHDHIQNALQGRIDFLLEEDQAQFSRLQEDAIKNLKTFEIEQSNWLDQFELKRTAGQVAADTVARCGGSWGFLGALGLFLAIWAIANLILTAYGPPNSAWDPYPFILLNLFLSMLAATQAPIIMMSQNRQTERDRLQTNFVSEAILRNEHETRHVDAKVDHLLSYQWKRLLEIQEIQIHLLELQIRHPDNHQAKLVHHFTSPKFNDALLASPGGLFSNRMEKPIESWNVEIQSDHLTKMLLRNYFDVDLSGDSFVFSHWHEDGDNFTGSISDVSLDITDRRLTHITFKINFSEILATMDDVFSGEGSVHLRNDFNILHMHHVGRIFRIRVIFANGAMATFLNGELPPRYKPAFARKRQDRITEMWKTSIKQLVITYVPPLQVAIVDVDQGHVLRRVTATIFPRPNGTIPDTSVYMAADGHPDIAHPAHSDPANSPVEIVSASPTVVTAFSDSRIDNPVVYCKQLVGPRPLSTEIWGKVVDYTWEPINPLSGGNGVGSDHADTQPIHHAKGLPRNPSRIHSSHRLGSIKASFGIPPKPIAASVVPTRNTSVSVKSIHTNTGGSNTAIATGSSPTSPPFDDIGLESVIVTAPVSVDIEQEFVGPATFVFICDDSRVCFHGDIEEITDIAYE
ncbi:hypothetical protein MT418_006926 [Batrachochytrium dendrobatidis]